MKNEPNLYIMVLNNCGKFQINSLKCSQVGGETDRHATSQRVPHNTLPIHVAGYKKLTNYK